MAVVLFPELQESHNLTFTGRNGTGKCIGVEIVPNGTFTRTTLYPRTSRNQTANCDIDIPLEAEAIGKIICALGHQLLDAAGEDKHALAKARAVLAACSRLEPTPEVP